MSELRAALACAGQLEQLCLIDAVPVFDVSPDNYHKLLTLKRLRRLEWSYPQSDDVQRLLHFFHFPSLVELDIAVVPGMPDTIDPSILGPNATLWVEPVEHRAVPLPDLQTLTLSCLEGSTCTLRQCITDKLQHVELIGGMGRLDWVLRDPRLPHLTHLLLADIDVDSNNVNALLSYVSQLESLTLERVTQVDALLLALYKTSDTLVQDTFGNVIHLRSMPCPQLKEIILWCCSNVTSEVLMSTVFWRNMAEWENDLGGASGSRLGKRADVIIQRPSQITSVRVEGCRGVTPHSSVVSTLHNLGVQDATVVCGDEGVE
ncbi:hypothetical protein BD626DRAFT_573504 [Schizophyllum amplum]|uniref:F-box domain-containing protein n=1 Tax=Schizophyllum amplum TaxID=97359 RepID=A0A550C178_9AGAR|nr:hypothetical protein BD626DRAFT_573504 [Auriculariopsis ampla]